MLLDICWILHVPGPARLPRTSQKALSFQGGDEWLFLVWGLGWALNND